MRFFDMEYVFVVERIRKVVNSCDKSCQLKTAKKYCLLLVAKWRREKYRTSGACFGIHFNALDLNEYADKLIKMKRKLVVN